MCSFKNLLPWLVDVTSKKAVRPLQIASTPAYLLGFDDGKSDFDLLPQPPSFNHPQLGCAIQGMQDLLKRPSDFSSLHSLREAWTKRCFDQEWCADAKTAVGLFQLALYDAYDHDMFSFEHVVVVGEWIIKVSATHKTTNFSEEEVLSFKSDAYAAAREAFKGTGASLVPLAWDGMITNMKELYEVCQILKIGPRIAEMDKRDLGRIVRVMPRKDGQTLAELMAKNTIISLTTANRMLSLVKDILEVCNRTHFLHADINNGNIIFSGVNAGSAIRVTESGETSCSGSKRKRTPVTQEASITAVLIDFGHVGFEGHPHTSGIIHKRVSDYPTYAATVVRAYFRGLESMLCAADAHAFVIQNPF